MLKHSVKIRRYLLCGCVWQHAATQPPVHLFVYRTLSGLVVFNPYFYCFIVILSRT